MRCQRLAPPRAEQLRPGGPRCGVTTVDEWNQHEELDGEHLDSEDHVSHATYSAEGVCPKGFPVHIPQLVTTVRFPIVGDGHDLTLASGSIYSAHGDFFNAWDPAGLTREVEACIHRDVVCDLASNRQEEGLFSHTS